MSKRGHTLIKDDKVDTPESVTDRLVPYLDPKEQISEPCAGANMLAARLEAHGFKISEAYDTEPRDLAIETADVADRWPQHLVVTNPPYGKKSRLRVLNALLAAECRAWLLIPSDWLTGQWFAPFAPHVTKIIPVGRVSWMGNGRGGYDNSAWVNFDFAEMHEFVMPRVEAKLVAAGVKT